MASARGGASMSRVEPSALRASVNFKLRCNGIPPRLPRAGVESVVHNRRLEAELEGNLAHSGPVLRPSLRRGGLQWGLHSRKASESRDIYAAQHNIHSRQGVSARVLLAAN
jgi:hypothetical protein